MFSTLSNTENIIFVTFSFSSANAFNLVWTKKNFSFGKELTLIDVKQIRPIPKWRYMCKQWGLMHLPDTRETKDILLLNQSVVSTVIGRQWMIEQFECFQGCW